MSQSCFKGSLQGWMSLTQKEQNEYTILDLSGHQIGDEGAVELGKALRNNTSLTSLNLSYNQIGDEGAKVLAESFRDNTSLMGDSDALISKQIGDEGAAALRKTLRGNTSLTKLDLSGNQIGDEGAAALLDDIPSSNLVVLSLGAFNDINITRMARITDALESNKAKLHKEFGFADVENMPTSFYTATPYLREAKEKYGLTNDKIKTIYSKEGDKLWEDPWQYIDELLYKKVDKILNPNPQDNSWDGISEEDALKVIEIGLRSQENTDYVVKSLFDAGFYGIAKDLVDQSVYTISSEVICSIMCQCVSEVNEGNVYYTDLLFTMLSKPDLDANALTDKMIESGMKLFALTAEAFGKVGIDLTQEQLSELGPEGFADTDVIKEAYKFAFYKHFASNHPDAEPYMCEIYGWNLGDISSCLDAD